MTVAIAKASVTARAASSRFNVTRDIETALTDLRTLARGSSSHHMLELCTDTLAEFPDSFEVYYHRAHAKLCLGDTLGAVADITDAIRCNGKDPALYYFRGLWKLELSRFSEALDDFSQAISRDAEARSEHYTEPCRMASAVAHLHLEQFDDALRASEGVDAGRKSFFDGRIWSVEEIRIHALHRRKPY